jgi:hypothetical protein
MFPKRENSQSLLEIPARVTSASQIGAEELLLIIIRFRHEIKAIKRSIIGQKCRLNDNACEKWNL